MKKTRYRNRFDKYSPISANDIEVINYLINYPGVYLNGWSGVIYPILYKKYPAKFRGKFDTIKIAAVDMWSSLSKLREKNIIVFSKCKKLVRISESFIQHKLKEDGSYTI